MPQGARVPAPHAVATIDKPRPASPAPGGTRQPTRSLQTHLLHYQRTVGNQAVQRLIRSGSPQPGALPTRISPVAKQSANAPHIQAAWYNFDIPFTDYQFDPSLQGIKTAAAVVKDTAVAGIEWIVDQIKSLVSSGIDWLSDKWNSIQAFATSAFDAAKNSFTNIIGFIKNPLGFLADALMSLDAQALTKAWARFSGLITTVANGFKAMTSTLLQQVNKIWGGINGFATSLLARISGLTENFLFKKLPDALQRVAFTVIDRLKSLWKSINDSWTKLFNKVKAWIDGALDTVFSFVRRVMSFGINVVIAGIIEFGKIVLFLKDFFSNPQKYLAQLASRSVKAFDGVESRFAGVVGQYFGSGGKTAAPAQGPTSTTHTRIDRAPDAHASAEAKTSASWGEIGHGIAGMMGQKWNEFKANPLGIVTGLLMDLFLPMVGNVKDVIQLFKDIKKIVTGPLSAGSLEELWTSLLQILDIPILIYHTVVSILMRSLMVPLIVATFVPHPLVKAIAAAVGYALLGAFVQSELANLGHKLLLLKTGATNKAQKEEAYNRIADSLIAMAMTVVIIVIMLILHFIAQVMKGVYNFVKGKVFGIEAAPVEGKGPAESKPGQKEPPSKDLGTQNGKKVLAEKATADGEHQVKVTEEGIRCCSPSCPLLIKDIDAAVHENPALKEKLDPLRKRLETAQGELESARLREDRAPNPEEAAKAAADVEKAAKAAADVAAEVKPEIDKVIREGPLPSGLRFNEYRTPENAIGMKEGKAKLVGSDPIKEPALRDQGYTDRHYYRDRSGTKWSVDVREVDGRPAYKEGKHSSGQEFD
jgi:Putative RNase-like toxin, toxin_1